MREFYQKYQGYLPAAFFIGGFLFDVVTTDRIDQLASLLMQLGYLLFIVLFLSWEVATPKVFLKENSKMAKLWSFHVELLHFLFGGLLSLYTIFYFKSTSSLTSLAFMVLLAGLLVINELPRFQKRGLIIRFSLLSLCLVSYLVYLVPVMTGTIGVFAFLLAMTLSFAIFTLICVRLKKKVEDENKVIKQMLVPGVIVQVLFVALYFLKVLPPVPVSLKYIGIYQDIEKQGDQYVLKYERPWWKFWQSGAQTFIAREGDRIFCFVSVFSPTEFKDQVQLVWYKKEISGWQKRDQVPMMIRGGRDEGFRGYSYKSNFDLGTWRVEVLTSDEREIGRINFEVVPGDTSQRIFHIDLY